MPRPIVVATAAPVPPMPGAGPGPKMNAGPGTLLLPLASRAGGIGWGRRLEAEKVWTTAKIDSATISRIIGMATRNPARPSGIAVRSRRDPASASRSIAQNRALGADTEADSDRDADSDS